MTGSDPQRGFCFRGLELHSSRMWQWGSVERALELMSELKLNALIFHQNDMLQQLVFPDVFYPPRGTWYSLRRHHMDNDRRYIQKVIRETRRRGMAFYFEIKEICFHEDLISFKPELMNADGSICASHPFWWEYLDAKIQELLTVLPDFSGIIVSPGTNETKVSIGHNTCTCQRCRSTDPGQWYQKLIDTLYRPLAANGKTLVVRDFTKTGTELDTLVDAATACSQDIVIALKFAPRDYYPPYPNNPRIGRVGEHAQWIEFDCWGQFFGLGFFPCSIVEDMKKRMDYCLDRGASGICLRTDWEMTTEGSAFNSFNLLNVFGGALLSKNPATHPDEIYARWLEYGLLSSLHSESEMLPPEPSGSPSDLVRFKVFMEASWRVLEKTLYVRGATFDECGLFPLSISEAFSQMARRQEWDSDSAALIVPTLKNTGVVLAEKAAALEEVQTLVDILKPRSLNLSARMRREIETMLDLYVLYVRGFQHCARVVYLTALTWVEKEVSTHEAQNAVMELGLFADELADHLKDTSFTHLAYWLLDHERLKRLCGDADSYLNGREPPLSVLLPGGGSR